MVLYYILTTFYVLVCLVLLLVVLLQQGRAATWRARSAAEAVRPRSVRAAARPCWRRRQPCLAALFMLSALALAIIGQRDPVSIVSGIRRPRRRPERRRLPCHRQAHPLRHRPPLQPRLLLKHHRVLLLRSRRLRPSSPSESRDILIGFSFFFRAVTSTALRR